MTWCLYIIILLFLILHVYLSLQKKFFLGYIIPLVTLAIIFFGMTTIKTYEIIYNNVSYKIETHHDYEKKKNELIYHKNNFEGILPKQNYLVFSLLLKVLLTVEILIYIICWLVKKKVRGI